MKTEPKSMNMILSLCFKYPVERLDTIIEALYNLNRTIRNQPVKAELRQSV